MPSPAAAASPPPQFRFKVAGMDCASCAKTIERAVTELDDVDEVRVNFTSETMEGSGRASAETLRKRVDALGYRLIEPSSVTPARPGTPTGLPGFVRFLWRHTETRIALVLGLVVLATIPVRAVGAGAQITSLIVIATSNGPSSRR